MKKFVKEITLFSFAELSEQAQKKAIEKFYDVNVSLTEWWEPVIEDAKNAGITIDKWDIEYTPYTRIKLNDTAVIVANKIIREHGPETGTYKSARKFLDQYLPVEKEMNDDINRTEDDATFIDECKGKLWDLIDVFTEELQDLYAKMLKEDYNYLTSEQAIKETIEANEYTFEEDGTMNNGKGYTEYKEKNIYNLSVITQRFDNIEIHPCKEFNEDGKSFVEQVDEKDAQFWSVYIHAIGGGLECISDCETFEQAQALRNLLWSVVALSKQQ